MSCLREGHLEASLQCATLLWYSPSVSRGRPSVPTRTFTSIALWSSKSWHRSGTTSFMAAEICSDVSSVLWVLGNKEDGRMDCSTPGIKLRPLSASDVPCRLLSVSAVLCGCVLAPPDSLLPKEVVLSEALSLSSPPDASRMLWYLATHITER